MPKAPDYDVIVIGGGGSGLAAAVSAAECGARVLLLEKRPQLGGTTAIAVGSFTACGTSYQRKQGLADNPEQHDADAGLFAPAEIEARNSVALRRAFIQQAAQTLEWLRALGLSFYGPSPEPPNRVPRMHNVIPGAKAYIAALQARLLRLGGKVLCRAHALELLQHEQRIGGVKADVEGQVRQFRAACGVILAAGDYANASGMIAQYKGCAFAQIEGINPYATGDGHRLAHALGAKLVNMDVTYGPEIRFVSQSGKTFLQLFPVRGPGAWLMGRLTPLCPKFILNAFIKRLLVTWQHPENALLADGAVLLNSRGERFCDETRWPAREIAIANQPDKICYLLLDERLIGRYSAWPHFISTAPEISYAYVDDYLRLRPDVAVSASGLQALAGLRGLPAAALRKSVAEFNAYAAGQCTDRFGRSGDKYPLQGARWVLLGPAKAYFTTTEGGVAIDGRFRVLNEQDEVIAGLYAVGQTGLGGQVLFGHGLHIAWAMTSGRLAGKIAARAGAGQALSLATPKR